MRYTVSVSLGSSLTYYYTESKESGTDKGDTTADTSKTDEQEQATGGAVGGGGAGTPAATVSAVEMPPLMIDGKECLPFQLQISYNNLDGAQCNRVITQVKPITKDRQVAEAGKLL